jgi:hypothetical protein
VVGVEFSPELPAIARQNIRQCQGFNHLCSNIQAACMDATRYELPVAPLVLYVYNPFLDEAMRQVADGVRASLARFPRPMVVIYATPLYDQLWSKVPALHRTLWTPACATYRSDGAPEGAKHQAAVFS